MTSASEQRGPDGTRLQAGDIVVDCVDGLIVETAEDRPSRILTGDRVRPGHVCAHTHLYSGLAPLGMPAPEPPPQNFLEILERVWWRLDRALNAEALRAGARLYVAEALLAGTTTLIDHHESPGFIEGSLDVLADACDELGVRALLCYGATERNGGQAEARRGLEECRRFISERAGGTLRGAVALHASFTVSDEVLREAGQMASELGAIVHVHMAEDAADVADARARGYEGPLERLMALNALPPGSILAHGVHLTETQVASAVDAGAWFVQNPRSNTGNGVGYALALRATDRVALGTDGYPAQMAAEIEAATEDPVAVMKIRLNTGQTLAGEVFDCRFGLSPGDVGDLVVEDEGRVKDVLVNGELVVADGRLLRGDLEEIRRTAQAAAGGLWNRMRNL